MTGSKGSLFQDYNKYLKTTQKEQMKTAFKDHTSTKMKNSLPQLDSNDTTVERFTYDRLSADILSFMQSYTGNVCY